MKRARTKPAYHFPVAAPVVEPEQQQVDIVSVDRDGKYRVVHVVLRRINIARPLCDALLGEQHSARYRMGAGVVVMAIGVSIAKVFGHVTMPVVAYGADAIGFGIHALGMVPFIEHLMEQYRARKNE